MPYGIGTLHSVRFAKDDYPLPGSGGGAPVLYFAPRFSMSSMAVLM